MALLLDILSWVMLVAGGGFVLVGGIGILRLPDLYTRMHANSALLSGLMPKDTDLPEDLSS